MSVEEMAQASTMLADKLRGWAQDLGTSDDPDEREDSDTLIAAVVEIERLRAAIRGALDAPLPPGKHATTGGVVFIPLAAALALREALA